MTSNYYRVFTNPITGKHTVGKPDGPTVATFDSFDIKKAEADAERRTHKLQKLSPVHGNGEILALVILSTH